MKWIKQLARFILREEIDALDKRVLKISHRLLEVRAMKNQQIEDIKKTEYVPKVQYEEIKAKYDLERNKTFNQTVKLTELLAAYENFPGPEERQYMSGNRYPDRHTKVSVNILETKNLYPFLDPRRAMYAKIVDFHLYGKKVHYKGIIELDEAAIFQCAAFCLHRYILQAEIAGWNGPELDLLQHAMNDFEKNSHKLQIQDS